MQKDAIAIILQVDCEPDSLRPHPGRAAAWEGLRSLFHILEEWRQSAQPDRPKPKVNWLWRVDPQVEACHGQADWAFTEFAREIESCAKFGDSHGLHPHAWRWSEELGNWLADHGNWPYIEKLTRQAVALYARNFGKTCESLRFGSEWFSAQLWDLESELGIQYDLTLVVDQPSLAMTPINIPSTGFIPDRRGFSNLPFRHGSLWIMPNATGIHRRLNKRFEGLEVKLRRWLGRTGDNGKGLPNYTASLAHLPRSFPGILDNALQKSDCRYLALCLRSDCGHGELKDRLIANLKFLSEHPLAERFRFVTPGEALELLQLA